MRPISCGERTLPMLVPTSRLRKRLHDRSPFTGSRLKTSSCESAVLNHLVIKAFCTSRNNNWIQLLFREVQNAFIAKWLSTARSQYQLGAALELMECPHKIQHALPLSPGVVNDHAGYSLCGVIVALLKSQGGGGDYLDSPAHPQ